jgi:hypothetical protein
MWRPFCLQRQVLQVVRREAAEGTKCRETWRLQAFSARIGAWMTDCHHGTTALARWQRFDRAADRSATERLPHAVVAPHLGQRLSLCANGYRLEQGRGLPLPSWSPGELAKFGGGQPGCRNLPSSRSAHACPGRRFIGSSCWSAYAPRRSRNQPVPGTGAPSAPAHSGRRPCAWAASSFTRAVCRTQHHWVHVPSTLALPSTLVRPRRRAMGGLASMAPSPALRVT